MRSRCTYVFYLAFSPVKTNNTSSRAGSAANVKTYSFPLSKKKKKRDRTTRDVTQSSYADSSCNNNNDIRSILNSAHIPSYIYASCRTVGTVYKYTYRLYTSRPSVVRICIQTAEFRNKRELCGFFFPISLCNVPTTTVIIIRIACVRARARITRIIPYADTISRGGRRRRIVVASSVESYDDFTTRNRQWAACSEKPTPE